MNEMTDNTIYANVERRVLKRVRKVRAIRAVAGFTAVTTGISGILAYVYIGSLGVGYISRMGLGEFAAKCVFDGVIEKIAPIKVEYEFVLDDADDMEYVEEDETGVLSQTGRVNIVAKDLSCKDPKFVFNETGYDTDALSVEVSAVVPEYTEGNTVLIIHSHGTESYADGDTVSADENFRTADTEKNVVAVGKRFADVLTENGINVIHCTEMFDLESYPDAYGNSAAAVKRYMEKYPDIRYVIDIHRDALIRDNGDVVKSDGGEGAQIMIVCGTDSMGAKFPDWQENFAFGLEYQRIMRETSPLLVRNMNLRRASFNQQLCDRYLLLEIGTCGNTLDEALVCAEFAADAYAKLLQSR